MTARGQFQTGSFAQRTVEFFKENPDEVLHTTDVQLKFGPIANIRTALARAVEMGWLTATCHHNRDGTTFTAGPRIKKQLEEA